MKTPHIHRCPTPGYDAFSERRLIWQKVAPEPQEQVPPAAERQKVTPDTINKDVSNTVRAAVAQAGRQSVEIKVIYDHENDTLIYKASGEDMRRLNVKGVQRMAAIDTDTENTMFEYVLEEEVEEEEAPGGEPGAAEAPAETKAKVEGKPEAPEIASEYQENIGKMKELFSKRYNKLDPKKREIILAALGKMTPKQAMALARSFGVLTPEERKIYDQAGSKVVKRLSDQSMDGVHRFAEGFGVADPEELEKIYDKYPLSEQDKKAIDTFSDSISPKEQEVWDKRAAEQMKLAGFEAPAERPPTDFDRAMERFKQAKTPGQKWEATLAALKALIDSWEKAFPEWGKEKGAGVAGEEGPEAAPGETGAERVESKAETAPEAAEAAGESKAARRERVKKEFEESKRPTVKEFVEKVKRPEAAERLEEIDGEIDEIQEELLPYETKQIEAKHELVNLKQERSKITDEKERRSIDRKIKDLEIDIKGRQEKIDSRYEDIEKLEDEKPTVKDNVEKDVKEIESIREEVEKQVENMNLLLDAMRKTHPDLAKALEGVKCEVDEKALRPKITIPEASLQKLKELADKYKVDIGEGLAVENGVVINPPAAMEVLAAICAVLKKEAEKEKEESEKGSESPEDFLERRIEENMTSVRDSIEIQGYPSVYAEGLLKDMTDFADELYTLDADRSDALGEKLTSEYEFIDSPSEDTYRLTFEEGVFNVVLVGPEEAVPAEIPGDTPPDEMPRTVTKINEFPAKSLEEKMDDIEDKYNELVETATNYEGNEAIAAQGMLEALNALVAEVDDPSVDAFVSRISGLTHDFSDGSSIRFDYDITNKFVIEGGAEQEEAKKEKAPETEKRSPEAIRKDIKEEAMLELRQDWASDIERSGRSYGIDVTVNPEGKIIIDQKNEGADRLTEVEHFAQRRGIETEWLSDNSLLVDVQYKDPGGSGFFGTEAPPASLLAQFGPGEQTDDVFEESPTTSPTEEIASIVDATVETGGATGDVDAESEVAQENESPAGEADAESEEAAEELLNPEEGPETAAAA